jgi:hypothetical protein
LNCQDFFAHCAVRSATCSIFETGHMYIMLISTFSLHYLFGVSLLRFLDFHLFSGCAVPLFLHGFSR